MNIQQWRNTIARYFPDYVLPAEVLLSVICQLAIKDITNPFGLVLVDRPSSGKTIVLNFLSGCKDLVYVTDNFSASAFVSHACNIKREDLESIDLLPKIKHKTFMVRDLAPLFGMRDDDLLKTMGILTRLFDGEGLISDSGLHGQRGYKGDYLFMFLAASTPIRPRVWRVMGNFGSRLFFLNMDVPTKNVDVLANQLRARYSPKRKERKCRKATSILLEKAFPGLKTVVWDNENENLDLLKEISILAKLVASLRGIVQFRENDKEGLDFAEVQIENPDRINQAFYNLARGHALACGRNKLADEDLAIVLNVALSSAPWERGKLLKLFIEMEGELKPEDVEEQLNVSKPTALKFLDILKHLGIIFDESFSLSRGGHAYIYKVSADFKWLLSSRFKQLNSVKFS